MNTVTYFKSRVGGASLAGVLTLAGTLSGAMAAMPTRAVPGDRNFVTFDAPGAAVGTVALDMNDSGVVTGYSIDANGVAHGFVRSTNGKLINFDGPGMADLGTIPSGINSSGVVVGTYDDSNGITHGFVRKPNGAITTLDIGTGGETAPWSVNASGAVVGYFLDAYDTYHGFLITAHGAVVVLDAPGAAAGSFQGTSAYNINSAGVVEGQFEDGSGVYHAFLRYPDGTFITVDAPNAGSGQFQGTLTGLERSLSDSGFITGEYLDINYAIHGFLRFASGRVEEFDVPRGSSASGSSTAPSSVNSAGDLVGWSTNSAGVTSGFVRRRDGSSKPIIAPGAGVLATYAVVINREGTIAGFYYDAGGIAHGFVRSDWDN